MNKKKLREKTKSFYLDVENCMRRETEKHFEKFSNIKKISLNVYNIFVIMMQLIQGIINNVDLPTILIFPLIMQE